MILPNRLYLLAHQIKFVVVIVLGQHFNLAAFFEQIVRSQCNELFKDSKHVLVLSGDEGIVGYCSLLDYGVQMLCLILRPPRAVQKSEESQCLRVDLLISMSFGYILEGA